MSDKLNNTIGGVIAVIVALAILYGVYTWTSNGNSFVNVIIGVLLLSASVLAITRLVKGKYPFNNFKNDWQTLAAWLSIAIAVIASLMFLSGFGNYAS